MRFVGDFDIWKIIGSVLIFVDLVIYELLEYIYYSLKTIQLITAKSDIDWMFNIKGVIL
jgi:hypothetical protein